MLCAWARRRRQTTAKCVKTGRHGRDSVAPARGSRRIWVEMGHALGQIVAVGADAGLRGQKTARQARSASASQGHTGKRRQRVSALRRWLNRVRLRRDLGERPDRDQTRSAVCEKKVARYRRWTRSGGTTRYGAADCCGAIERCRQQKNRLSYRATASAGSRKPQL